MFSMTRSTAHLIFRQFFDLLSGGAAVYIAMAAFTVSAAWFIYR